MLTYDKKHNENYSVKGSIWNTFFQKKVSLCCLFLFTIFIQAQKNQSKDSVTFAAHYLNENKKTEKTSEYIYITKDAFVYDPENTISTKKTIVNEEKNKVQNKKIVLEKKTSITKGNSKKIQATIKNECSFISTDERKFYESSLRSIENIILQTSNFQFKTISTSLHVLNLTRFERDKVLNTFYKYKFSSNIFYNNSSIRPPPSFLRHTNIKKHYSI